MPKQRISKDVWLRAIECPTGAWLTMRRELPHPSESEKFRMDQGLEIGMMARELFPNGVLISRPNTQSASKTTRELMGDGTAKTLFEATAIDEPLAAKADVLHREDSGWHVMEVKSSFADTSKLDEYTDDLAYTAMVFGRAGFHLGRASLVLLSREYEFGDGTDALFEIIDRTAEVEERVSNFNTVAADVVSELLGAEQPTPALIGACKNCPYFPTDCMGVGVKHSVLELPRLHATKLKTLAAGGIVDLSELPPDFKLTETQRRVRDAVLSGDVYIGPGLREALNSISWPCHYLDFETVATVMPLYEGRHCFEQVLTQFSVHHCNAAGAKTGHDEYLADAGSDCERELATRLIRALGDKGSVITYSGFERTRIQGLTKRFPDLANELRAISGRLENLLAQVSKHVYHPKFLGSFSIKTVLPALVPDLSYESLDIQDGDTAITRFARMARGEIVGDDADATRRQLLEYCKMDTLAMARLHERLEGLCT